MIQAGNLMARLLHRVGIDFHVRATLLSRGWSVLAGAVTVLMVPAWLTTVEQGYYYTIASLLGLQVLFELGGGQVIVQLVGHDAAYLRHVDNGTLAGETGKVDRIASLTHFFRLWYRLAALLFCVLAGVAGFLLLGVTAQLPPNQWLLVWVVMVLASAVNLTYVPALALHEGLGRIGEVARLRLIQSIIGYLGFWVALVANFSLWAACIVPLTNMLVTRYWLEREGRVHRWLIERHVAPENCINWRGDVLPFQWRIALSALSGYFIFYAFTPLIFANRGAADAGRFGIAMAVFNALAAVGTSWVYANTANFAMHIARGERRELNVLFWSALRRSVLFTTLVATCIVLAVAALDSLGVSQMKRIAEPSVLACLAVVCAANSIIFSVAAYMRAHREEPMLCASLFGATATGLLAYFGSMHDVFLMSLLFAILTVGVLLPWSLLLFFRYYRRP